jgi:hypothetical protein
VLWRNRCEPADLGVSLLEVEGNGPELLQRYREQVFAATTY